MSKQDVIRLLIIMAIAGSGFVRWVFVKLQEQAAKKRVQDQLEHQRIESIRTGQDMAQSAPDPEVERAKGQAEVAVRRQAQIEEFRRRQQERARQRAETQQRGPVTPSGQARQAPTAPAPAPRPAARQQVQRPVRQLLTQSTSEPAAAPDAQETHRLVANQEQRPVVVAARALLHAPQTSEQWRRAIIMNTLLSPPPGLGTGDDPWSPVS